MLTLSRGEKRALYRLAASHRNPAHSEMIKDKENGAIPRPVWTDRPGQRVTPFWLIPFLHYTTNALPGYCLDGRLSKLRPFLCIVCDRVRHQRNQ